MDNMSQNPVVSNYRETAKELLNLSHKKHGRSLSSSQNSPKKQRTDYLLKNDLKKNISDLNNDNFKNNPNKISTINIEIFENSFEKNIKKEIVKNWFNKLDNGTYMTLQNSTSNQQDMNNQQNYNYIVVDKNDYNDYIVIGQTDQKMLIKELVRNKNGYYGGKRRSSKKKRSSKRKITEKLPENINNNINSNNNIKNPYYY